MRNRNRRRLVFCGLGVFLAVSVAFSWNRLASWRYHRAYLLENCPEVVVPEACTLMSSGFWESIWRIPSSVRHTNRVESSPLPDVHYTFVWFSGKYDEGGEVQQRLAEFETRLLKRAWIRLGTWQRLGDAQLGKPGAGGLLRHVPGTAQLGRYVRMVGEHHHEGIDLFVMCWQDEDSIKIRVVGRRFRLSIRL